MEYLDDGTYGMSQLQSPIGLIGPMNSSDRHTRYHRCSRYADTGTGGSGQASAAATAEQLVLLDRHLAVGGNAGHDGIEELPLHRRRRLGKLTQGRVETVERALLRREDRGRARDRAPPAWNARWISSGWLWPA